MNINYKEIFKELINSYYENNFDNKVTELLSKENIDKTQVAKTISSLCGVDVDFSDNYIINLKNAIISYEAKHKIVTKIKSCSMDCADKNGKTRCQVSCPFDAILIDKEKHTTYIAVDKCTDCGLCVDSCTSGSIIDKVEFLPLVNLIQNNTTVIAAVAPAITGQFGKDVNANKIRTALKKVGFTDMVEVAFFADMLTLKEAVEFDNHVKSKDDLMITSCCCPMWVGMLKKVYGELVKHVSPSVSPMIAAGRILKLLNPHCKVVFIGPCIAKKSEAKEKDLIGDIDFVLTFSELKEIFDSLNINPNELPEDISTEYASKGGRLYARTGGVSIAIADAMERLFPEKHKLLTAVQGNGVKECKELLNKAMSGEINANFIEGMGCIGGCVGGPKSLVSKEEGTISIDDFANNSEIKVAVDSHCMQKILNQIGITSIEDFKDEEKTKIFHRDF